MVLLLVPGSLRHLTSWLLPVLYELYNNMIINNILILYNHSCNKWPGLQIMAGQRTMSGQK